MKEKRVLLLPTDFTVKSLNLVREALNKFPNQSLDIWLVHGIDLTLSTADLLFYSAGRHLAQHQSQEFKSALKMIESKYHPQLGRVHLDIINSSNSSYLKSYVQARHITDVMIPVNYHFKLVDKSSFDLVSLFSELKPDKHELNWGVSKSSASDGVNYLGGMFEDFDMILQPGK